LTRQAAEQAGVALPEAAAPTVRAAPEKVEADVTAPPSPMQAPARGIEKRPPGEPAPPADREPVAGYVDDGRAVRPLQPAEAGAASDAAGDGRMLQVPIQTPEETLGLLTFEPASDDRRWSEDDQLLAEAVAQQLALSLQDARARQLTERALDEMREADRLKTQFLANMSHELRTPLNSIIGFSRVILKGIDGPVTDLQEQDLRAIYNAGMHLLGLINDILDLSKIDAGKMELTFAEVDLREIIHGVMSTAKGLVKDRPIELITDVPEDLPVIVADSIRVRQILLNLISNSTKFTERGRIGVRARLAEEAGRPEIRVQVSDTGPGIDPRDQDKLFEPFSQVDASPTRKTGGTGLGLSICRHLVELHGGRIWIESALGKGSTFTFTLPLRPPAEVLSPRLEAPQRA
jgi:signal transduction histidine kinase